MRLNDQEQEIYSSLKTDEARRLFYQVYFKKRFREFLGLLGYKNFGKFHEGEIGKLQRVRKIDNDGVVQGLWLWSRGFFKTTIVTEAHAAWLIVNNPDIRLLIRSNTISIAETMLKNIKGHFMFNEDFRFFFKEFVPKANGAGKIEFGTSTEFTVPNRVKILKEPTVLASGIGTNLTGLHFDYQKVDDIVTKDSVTNEEQIEASKDDYRSLRHLFDKPSCPKEDVVGTIYHFNDLYCELRKKKSHVESFIPATVDGLVTGEAIFPERLNKDQIEKMFEDLGPYQTMTQYFLNPVNPKDAKFKEEWIKYYEKVPDGCASYICIDPASTQKKKSDYTVIERWDIDKAGYHYLVAGVRDKLTVFQRMDKIVEMARGCKRLAAVRYEVLGGRHGDLEQLKKRFFEEKLPIVPEETKNTTGAKADRIEQRLVVSFNKGQILLPNSLIYRSMYDGKVKDFVQEYLLEFLQFPFTEHDDVLDCHSQMFETPMMLVKGLDNKPPTENKGITADQWDRLYAQQKRIQKSNPFMTGEQINNRIRGRQIKRILQNVIK